MSIITEISPDVYRISTYIPDIDLQFNQFLVKDDEPLLFHAGLRALFPQVKDAVASVIDPASLRWIAMSHFEADECGALNEWLGVSEMAEPVCGLVAALVSINDFSDRPARVLEHDEVLETGRHRMRYLRTPQVPHAWDAGLLFEETSSTFLCSDLFHHSGNVEPITDSDVVERMRRTFREYQSGPLAEYFPYTHNTDAILQSLAELKPRVCATMHGSAFSGDGERAIKDMARMLREEVGGG